MTQENLAKGCPVEMKYGPYHVRYGVKRTPCESIYLTEMHSEMVCFHTKEHRQRWIEWHREHTRNFVVLKEWEVAERPLCDTQAAVREAQRLEALQRARQFRKRRWCAMAIDHATKS